MHKIQKAILAASEDTNINEMGLRKLGALIGVDHPQKVKWHLEKLIRDGQLLYTAGGELIRPLNNKVSLNLIALPILGRANCGEPLHFAGEDPGEVIQVSKSLLPQGRANNCFAVRAVGESMNRAKVKGQPINDGDLVVVDSTVDGPEDDDYILVSIDGLATIKRFHLDKARQRIYLMPESSLKINPIVIDASDEDSMRMHGLVIDVIPALA